MFNFDSITLENVKNFTHNVLNVSIKYNDVYKFFFSTSWRIKHLKRIFEKISKNFLIQ